MRVLSFDPGSVRMGWAVQDGVPPLQPKHVASGVFYYPRGDREPYQPYRLKMLEDWFTNNTPMLLDEYAPHKVATEIVPSRGAGEAGMTKLMLAQSNVDAVDCACMVWDVPFEQIAHSTWVKAVYGEHKKDEKVTKQKARNAVLEWYPELRTLYWKAWLKEFEQPDAIGVGLAGMGYKRNHLLNWGTGQG